jgi:hypothetical protein
MNANVRFRQAQESDALDLACLIDSASRGLALWLWSTLRAPGQSTIEVGRDRIRKLTASPRYYGDVARRRRLARDIRAGDPDPALIRRLEAADQAERGRLAGTGRAEQNHELAVANRQRQLVHGRDLAEPLGHALDYDLSHERLR